MVNKLEHGDEESIYIREHYALRIPAMAMLVSLFKIDVHHDMTDFQKYWH
jgi:hypothetical protein